MCEVKKTGVFTKAEQLRCSVEGDSNFDISEEFETQSLAAVELFTNDVIVRKINPKVIFIFGDKGTGKSNLANTLQLQFCNVKVIRDKEFSDIDDLVQFMKGGNLSSNLTIFDNLTIHSLSSLRPREASLCTNDLVEGACRCLGITKLLIRTRRVLQRDIKSYFEESLYNENSFIFTNIFKGL